GRVAGGAVAGGGVEVGGQPGGVVHQAALQQLPGGQGGGGGDGVASEGGAVAAVVPFHDVVLGDEGAQGHAGGDALGHRDDVRLQAEVLAGEHPAGATHAALHLVGDQEDAV